jgi:hypothetical protein
MNDEQLYFYKGLESALPKEDIKSGALYHCTDTGNTYIGVSATEYHLYSSAVGKKTLEGGEIFNNYYKKLNSEDPKQENNTYAPYSTASGYSATAGARGYKLAHVEAIDTTGNTVYMYVIGNAESLLGKVIGFDGKSHFTNLRVVEASFDEETNDTLLKVTTTDGSALPTTGLAVDGYKEPDDSADSLENWVWSAEVPDTGTVGSFSRGACAGGDVEDNTEANIAVGRGAWAYGRNVKAIGNYSHAEGRGTEAGYAAHAEGQSTKATGQRAHAEGVSTTASGINSHAEGFTTIAADNAAHAEGYRTEARALGAHSEGSGTIATSEAQHVQGAYNVIDTAGKYIHIQGSGRSASTRTNIHTINKYYPKQTLPDKTVIEAYGGEAWFLGPVKVGGTHVDDENAKTLATEEFVEKTAKIPSYNIDGNIGVSKLQGVLTIDKGGTGSATREGSDKEQSASNSLGAASLFKGRCLSDSDTIAALGIAADAEDVDYIADLNKLLEVGDYYCTAAPSKTIKNWPISGAYGHAQVYIPAQGFKAQEVKNMSTGATYYRYYTDSKNSWSSWSHSAMLDSSNKLSVTSIGTTGNISVGGTISASGDIFAGGKKLATQEYADSTIATRINNLNLNSIAGTLSTSKGGTGSSNKNGSDTVESASNSVGAHSLFKGRNITSCIAALNIAADENDKGYTADLDKLLTVGDYYATSSTSSKIKNWPAKSAYGHVRVYNPASSYIVQKVEFLQWGQTYYRYWTPANPSKDKEAYWSAWYSTPVIDKDGNLTLAGKLNAANVAVSGQLTAASATMSGTLSTKGIILTEGTDYGDTKPTSGTYGKLFFVKLQ